MEEDGRKDQKDIYHKCFHEEDWEKVDGLKDRVCNLERDRETEREELEQRDARLKLAFDENTSKLDEILDVVNGLDKQQALTDQHNGFQDEQIRGINVAEREKIRNKWVIIGIVAGAIAGPIIIKIIEYFTPL